MAAGDALPKAATEVSNNIWYYQKSAEVIVGRKRVVRTDRSLTNKPEGLNVRMAKDHNYYWCEEEAETRKRELLIRG